MTRPNPASTVDGGDCVSVCIRARLVRHYSARAFSDMNLIALIPVLLVATPALEARVQFPSKAASKSPDGKWQVVCKSPGESDPQSGHLLLLKRIGATSAELQRFDRHCGVLWSP